MTEDSLWLTAGVGEIDSRRVDVAFNVPVEFRYDSSRYGYIVASCSRLVVSGISRVLTSGGDAYILSQSPFNKESCLLVYNIHFLSRVNNKREKHIFLFCVNRSRAGSPLLISFELF